MAIPIDCTIKDEGDFFTLLFNTDKSRKTKLYAEMSAADHFNKDQHSFAYAKESRYQITSLLVSYALSWNNF